MKRTCNKLPGTEIRAWIWTVGRFRTKLCALNSYCITWNLIYYNILQIFMVPDDDSRILNLVCWIQSQSCEHDSFYSKIIFSRDHLPYKKRLSHLCYGIIHLEQIHFKFKLERALPLTSMLVKTSVTSVRNVALLWWSVSAETKPVFMSVTI